MNYFLIKPNKNTIMKKTFILSLALLMFAGMLHAQYNTGNVFFSADSDLGMYMQKETYKSDLGDGEPENQFYFNINPKAGYFIKQRLAVGGMMMFDYSKFKDLSESSYSSVVIGPMVRYYRGYYKGVSSFGELTAGIGRSTDKYMYEGIESVTKHNLKTLSAGVGANLFLADNVAAEAMIKYAYENSKGAENNPDNNRHITSGLVFTIGFTVYILKI